MLHVQAVAICCLCVIGPFHPISHCAYAGDCSHTAVRTRQKQQGAEALHTCRKSMHGSHIDEYNSINNKGPTPIPVPLPTIFLVLFVQKRAGEWDTLHTKHIAITWACVRKRLLYYSIQCIIPWSRALAGAGSLQYDNPTRCCQQSALQQDTAPWRMCWQQFPLQHTVQPIQAQLASVMLTFKKTNLNPQP